MEDIQSLDFEAQLPGTPTIANLANQTSSLSPYMYSTLRFSESSGSARLPDCHTLEVTL